LPFNPLHCEFLFALKVIFCSADENCCILVEKHSFFPSVNYLQIPYCRAYKFWNYCRWMRDEF